MKSYSNYYRNHRFWINWLVLIFCVSILYPGCKGGCNGAKKVAPPPKKANIPQAVLDCIVGKKVKFTGTYIGPYGVEIPIKREADISSDVFKVKTTGEDELPEEAKVDLWEGSAISCDDDGTESYGFRDEKTEDCYKIKYISKPFDGPSGKCVFEIWGRICVETCTITKASWKLRCDCKEDGSGGKVKAYGNWSVE